MYHVIEPTRCSKCHSCDIYSPVNPLRRLYYESEVEMKCMSCGHSVDKPVITTQITTTQPEGELQQWVHDTNKPREF